MTARNEYIVLDIDKGTEDNNTTTYINLTPRFQGRVADSKCTVNLQFRRHGLPLDLTKLNIGFEGVDPNGKRFKGVGWESYDLPGADEQIGKINYYFPAGMFQVEGQWDPDGTYFYVDDGNGTRISTIGICLNVLPNLVEMGVNAKPFETDMDRVVAEVRSYADKKMQEIGNLTERFNQLEGALTALKAQIRVYTDLINSKAVPTVNDMHDYARQLGQGEKWTSTLNDATDPKVYLISAGAEHSPSELDGTLYVYGSGNCTVQIFIDSDTNEYIRTAKNGTWGYWYLMTQFPTDANMYPSDTPGGSTTVVPGSGGGNANPGGGTIIGGGSTTIIADNNGGVTATTSSRNAAAVPDGTATGPQPTTPSGLLDPAVPKSSSSQTDADKYGGSIASGETITNG